MAPPAAAGLEARLSSIPEQPLGCAQPPSEPWAVSPLRHAAVVGSPAPDHSCCAEQRGPHRGHLPPSRPPCCQGCPGPDVLSYCSTRRQRARWCFFFQLLIWCFERGKKNLLGCLNTIDLCREAARTGKGVEKLKFHFRQLVPVIFTLLDCEKHRAAASVDTSSSSWMRLCEAAQGVADRPSRPGIAAPGARHRAQCCCWPSGHGLQRSLGPTMGLEHGTRAAHRQEGARKREAGEDSTRVLQGSAHVPVLSTRAPGVP